MPIIDFDALAQTNPEVVGWIYAPGTNINYPVVQTNNNSKYLNTLFDGTANASGAIFLDSNDTAPGMVDQQTTIYGHHMNDGSMFNVISDTTDQVTFDSIEYAYYITRDATYKLRPLATKVVEDTYAKARTPNFVWPGATPSVSTPRASALRALMCWSYFALAFATRVWRPWGSWSYSENGSPYIRYRNACHRTVRREYFERFR